MYVHNTYDADKLVLLSVETCHDQATLLCCLDKINMDLLCVCVCVCVGVYTTVEDEMIT